MNKQYQNSYVDMLLQLKKLTAAQATPRAKAAKRQRIAALNKLMKGGK